MKRGDKTDHHGNVPGRGKQPISSQVRESKIFGLGPGQNRSCFKMSGRKIQEKKKKGDSEKGRG